MVSAGAGARTRRRDPVDAHQRARHRRLARSRPRATRRRSGDGRDAAGAEGPLARARDRSAICAAPSAGSTSPRAACSRSSRRARASPARCSNWRSPATASTIWRFPATRTRAAEIVVGEQRISATIPMASGPEPARPALLRRGARARCGEGEDRRAARTPTPPSPWASPPASPTTSTGATRCGSRSRSACR